MDLSYIINILGEERERYAGAVAPPVWQTSIFAFESVRSMRALFADEYANTVYTRGNNPTVEMLRKKLAALEGAEAALAVASGAAAVAVAVLGSVRAGDHVVAVAKPYSWTKTLLRRHLPRFGVESTLVDARDTAAVEAAMRPNTRAIVLESPNSLTFEQQDLAAVAALAKAHGARTICDNSYATPLGQSPLALGIDVVVHSATKYLAGHSDVMAGAVCASEAVVRELFEGPFMTLGPVLSPHDAWLVIRGLRTFPARMERIAATTRRVVAYLEAHPKVERLNWPQSPSYAQKDLTERQLRHASGLLSFELAGGVGAVERFCDALRRFLMAVSWGGYESLAFPVAGVRDWTGLEAQSSVPVNLVRLSIGLEDADVLIADLDQALAKA